MELKVKEQSESPLLRRKTMVIEASFAGKPTPSNQEMRKEIAAFLKTQENVIKISHIIQQFGRNSARITLHQYKDEQALKAGEKSKKKKREGQQSGKEEAKK